MQATISARRSGLRVDVSLGEGCIQLASVPQPTLTEHKADSPPAGSDSAKQPVLPPSSGTGGGQASGTETSTQPAGAGTASGAENPAYDGCSFDIQITYGESEKASRARMDDYFQRLSADIVRFMSNPVR